VSRTARLQRDFLATLHATADAQLLASLKQREQAMREAWQQHQRQRQQPAQIGDRRLATWLQALAADLPAQAWLTRLEYQGRSDAGRPGPQPAGAGQLEAALTASRDSRRQKPAERSATPRGAGSSVLP
jgi:Tfp pilus assembly protein PilN